MSEDLTAEIENTAAEDVITDSSTVPGAEAKPEGEAEASATETPEASKKVNPVQPRINQLIRDKYEKDQENAELRARLDKLEQAKPAAVDAVVNVPKEDDFEDYADFQAAQAKFVADTAANAAYDRIKAENQTSTEETAQETRRKEIEAKKSAFEEALESKRDNFQDFEEIAYMNPFMDMDLVDQIFGLDKGIEVSYHLGANLDEAERIFKLPPVQRARELTKLEFQVEAVKPKKVSEAPDPITPLGGSEKVEVDPDKMTADEWQQWEYDRQRAKG